MTVEIELLGVSRLAVDGEPQRLPSSKAWALLAYLILEADQPQPRSKLTELFWGDASDERARQSLRQALYELRKTLSDYAESCLLVEGDWVTFQVPAEVQVDVLDLLNTEWEHVDFSQIDLTVDQGIFLAEVDSGHSPTFEHWLSHHRQRCEQHQLRHDQIMLQQLINQHAFKEALPFARELVNRDPLNEAGHRALMLIHAGLGNRQGVRNQYELCRDWLARELDTEPEHETQELYEKLTRGRIVPNNLPAQTTTFVGREPDVGAVCDLLRTVDVRLVTLVGLGGIGKTRLALAVGAQMLPTVPDGVFFVALTPASDQDAIVSSVAQAIGYQIQSGTTPPPQQLFDYIEEKRLLLILDNFEHLLDMADFVTVLLEKAPGVQVLVTSRARLNLQSETVYALSGLGLPDLNVRDSVWQSDAVELFFQAAQRSDAQFEPDSASVTAIAQICKAVQGMPLAILLAAGWVPLLSVDEIYQEIMRGLDVLTGERKDAPERHWSVRAVFTPTWHQLSNDERAALMRLTVFRGGFTRAAAEAVAGASLPTLASLVNRSLVQRGAAGRYDLHELLRQFSIEQLQAAGLEQATSDAHSRFYLDFAAQLEADLKGLRQRGAIDDIVVELENIRTAWEWAVQRGHDVLIYDAVESLFHFYDFHVNVPEFMALREQALAVFEGRTRGRLLRSLPGSPEASQKVDVEEALSIALDHNDRHEIARCLIIGGFAWFGSEPEAIENLLQGLEICREIGDAFYESQALGWVGYQMGLAEQYEEAFNYDSEAIVIARREGNLIWLSQYLTDRAGTAMLANPDYSAVAESVYEARIICIEMNIPISVMYADTFLCSISWLQGEFARSQEIAAKSLQLAKETGLVNAYYWHTLNFLALALCMQEKYDEAEVYALEAASHVHQEWRAAVYFSTLAQTCIYLGLNRPERIQQAIRDYMKEYDMITVYVYYIASVMAFLSANDGKHEEATQLLSAAMHNPWNPEGGWLENWAAISHLRADLQKELGEVAFASAWENGQSLDLETMVRGLLESFT